jgi:purine-binding chemotaxis protein CheW
VTQDPREVLIFEIDGQRYGLPAADVRELLRAVALTPLPGAPPVVEGVINIRGRVVPVLNVRGRFHRPARAIEPSDHLVVVRVGSRPAALRVDRAVELRRLDPADLEKAEGVLPGVDYIAQVARLPDGLVFIHDLRTFLSQAEFSVLDEVLPAAAGEGAAS